MEGISKWWEWTHFKNQEISRHKMISLLILNSTNILGIMFTFLYFTINMIMILLGEDAFQVNA